MAMPHCLLVAAAAAAAGYGEPQAAAAFVQSDSAHGSLLQPCFAAPVAAAVGSLASQALQAPSCCLAHNNWGAAGSADGSAAAALEPDASAACPAASSHQLLGLGARVERGHGAETQTQEGQLLWAGAGWRGLQQGWVAHWGRNGVQVAADGQAGSHTEIAWLYHVTASVPE